MEITQLRYFKAVAETGKIVTAANAMFVTPPTISTSISQLEKELGVSLFQRDGHRLTLNRQGEIFLERVNQILSIFRYACIEVTESASEGPHHLAVAITSANIWVDLLASFSLRHPECMLSTATMTSLDLRSGMFTNHYSFLLGAEDDFIQIMPQLENEFLFEDAPAVMVYPSHPFAQRKSIKPEELENERIVWPRINQYMFVKMRRMLELHGVSLPYINTHSYLVCRSLVRQGSCIMLTTTHTAFPGDEVVHVPIESPETRWRVYLCRHKDRPLNEDEQHFYDFLQAYYHLKK